MAQSCRLGDGGLYGGFRVCAGLHLMARVETWVGISRVVHCRGGGHRYGQDAGGGVVSIHTIQRNVFTDPDRNGSDADEGNEVGNVERRIVCRGLAIAGRDRVAAVFQDPVFFGSGASS